MGWKTKEEQAAYNRAYYEKHKAKWKQYEEKRTPQSFEEFVQPLPDKKCCSCEQYFPSTLDYWHRNKKGKYGLCNSCIECAITKTLTWQIENRERVNQKNRDWINGDPERKARKTASVKLWEQNNSHKVRAKFARYRAAKIQALPSWANLEKIEAIYKDCRNLSRESKVPYHVDHIDPLQSDLVYGLHVHENLQILVGTENQSKGNTFIPYSVDRYGSVTFLDCSE
jgi:hypothetical protein